MNYNSKIPYIGVYIWNLGKMALMDLFVGQEQRHRHSEWTYRHGGRGRRGWDELRE